MALNMTNLTSGQDSYNPCWTPLVSDFAVIMFLLINHVILSSCLCVTGIVANVINICVFLKQGLGTSTSISFFSLSVADLLGLVTLLWYDMCLNPYLANLDTGILFKEVAYLTSGWPHGCASRITSWTTVFITAERCLSIALPLKIKHVITPERTTAIIIIIYLINILSLVPEYSSAYYDWTFNVAKNKTVFGLVFRSNRPQTAGLSFLFHGSFTLISFFSVVTFTSVLVLELRRTSKWRQRAVNSGKQTTTMSKRDRKTMIMVVLVATSLIVCFVPTVVLSIVTISVSEFSVVGKEVNLFNTCWSFGFLLHSVNSNVHFLLYYKMSSKFRSTFQNLFRRTADTLDTHDTQCDDHI
ncbi:G-protein coupled receptor [Biomphalaria glabrata]|nr:putative G-protein coupled receptor [Biomphalaria glabrata]